MIYRPNFFEALLIIQVTQFAETLDRECFEWKGWLEEHHSWTGK